ncbi:MAG: hypothetical protein E7290_14865 [Lachnospiraceae bacterium]|nr:hypothetical protein [Lachnospiraceae bacterium]
MKRVTILNRNQKRVFDALIDERGRIYFETKKPKMEAEIIALDEVISQIGLETNFNISYTTEL